MDVNVSADLGDLIQIYFDKNDEVSVKNKLDAKIYSKNLEEGHKIQRNILIWSVQ